MNITIRSHQLKGVIPAQPSKSFAHRALICAALSGKRSSVSLSDVSNDVHATISCLEALGSEISVINGRADVSPISKPPSKATLDCGESGSTLRFMMPVAASLGVETKFVTSGRLSERPLGELVSQLCSHGISFTASGIMKGKLRPGKYTLPGNVSSQYVTGLLLALPLAGDISVIDISSELLSKPYVDITLSVMRSFGADVIEEERSYTVHPLRKYAANPLFVTEGDWSNAAFWLASGCSVNGLSSSSVQGDAAVADIITRLGGSITVSDDMIIPQLGRLHGCTIDASDIPDIVPPVAVLCALSQGESRITGASRLRLKESDRIKSVAAMLSAIGGDVTETEDGFIFRGVGSFRGGRVNSAGDHRIAMSAAVASCYSSGDITVEGAEAVEKSYPSFWDDFRKLGGEFTVS